MNKTLYRCKDGHTTTDLHKILHNHTGQWVTESYCGECWRRGRRTPVELIEPMTIPDKKFLTGMKFGCGSEKAREYLFTNVPPRRKLNYWWYLANVIGWSSICCGLVLTFGEFRWWTPLACIITLALVRIPDLFARKP